MAIDGIDDTPCVACTFWGGRDKGCGHTWRLMVHIQPMGGQIDFSTTPGMVPEHMKQRLTDFFDAFTTKLANMIQHLPIWDEIREWQLANPDRERCPGRTVIGGIPYLRVVGVDDLKFSFEKEGCHCPSK